MDEIQHQASSKLFYADLLAAEAEYRSAVVEEHDPKIIARLTRDYLLKRLDVIGTALERVNNPHAEAALEWAYAEMILSAFDAFRHAVWLEYPEAQTPTLIKLLARKDQWRARLLRQSAEGVLRQDTNAQAPPTDNAPQQDEGATIPAAARAGGEAADTRRERVERYIQGFLDATGNRLTKTDIARLAGHRTTRQFEYWMNYDTRATNRDNHKFPAILSLQYENLDKRLKTMKKKT